MVFIYWFRYFHTNKERARGMRKIKVLILVIVLAIALMAGHKVYKAYKTVTTTTDRVTEKRQQTSTEMERFDGK